MADFTKLEEITLVSILNLKENAYGVFIRSRISEVTGKQLNYGTLYRILDQLVRKGLLERREGEPLPEKGGRRKKYYRLTKSGLQTLQDAYSMQSLLWGDTTKSALKEALDS